MNHGYEGGRRILTQDEVDAQVRHQAHKSSLDEAFGIKSGEIAAEMGPLTENDIIPMEDADSRRMRHESEWRDHETDRLDAQDRLTKEQGIRNARLALLKEQGN